MHTSVLTLSSEGERTGGAHSSEVILDETFRALGADLVPPDAASRRGCGVLARQTDIYHASTTVEVATAVISTCVIFNA